MRFKLIEAALLAMMISNPCHAEGTPAPTTKVVLTVTGEITRADHGQATFELPELEAMEGRRAVMETPWTAGNTEFSGPFLRSILEAVGAKGGSIRLVALNDYSADIPLTDATELDTILATRMNGEPMSVRDKGPLFLIYPFDQGSELYNEKYFSRSVWQIKEIRVLP